VSLDVGRRGLHIATFRFVAVRLMETAAAWTPTTPEMEAKVLLGRHIWDFAQHADVLGRRTFELRLPAQHSLQPSEGVGAVLRELAVLERTEERLFGLYELVLPDLERRYRSYLDDVDHVLDGPSVVVIENILADLARQRREADELRRELSPPAPPCAALRDALAACGPLLAPEALRG